MSVSIPLAAGPSRLTTEASLFHQAQAGCRDSLDRLMATHDGLVQAAVRRQVLGQLPFAEAVQAGRLGLWRAILGYDPQRGGAFSTYAWPAIQRHIWRAVQVYHRPRTLPARTACGTPSLDPAQVWETAGIQAALYDLVARLPSPRLRYIVVARYGLTGEPPATYPQIGAVVGLSAERVRQLHTEALVWLRHPAHAQQLRSWLERHTVADYEAADGQAQCWLRQRGGRHDH
jgi:RNA polymerase sigma factor (sigma-70 family)